MKSGNKKDEVEVSKMIALEQELHELKQKQGIEEKGGKLSGMISRYFDRKEAREEKCLNRKKYLLLALFTGWMGGHRYYAKQYPVAILYTVLFWTGIPIAMTIIDLLIAIPKETDENGMMML